MAQIFASERGSASRSSASRPHQTRSRQDHTAHPAAQLSHLQMRADNSAVVQRLARWSGRGVAQRQTGEAQTSGGLPANLQGGLEAMSGLDLSDVKVHRNSAQPAEVGALAYAQGTDIHLGPGQEKHLPHEAWHAVQQKQGRVQATRQMKDAVPINDDADLEAEADVMGAKAAQAAAQMVSDDKDA